MDLTWYAPAWGLFKLAQRLVLLQDAIDHDLIQIKGVAVMFQDARPKSVGKCHTASSIFSFSFLLYWFLFNT